MGGDECVLGIFGGCRDVVLVARAAGEIAGGFGNLAAERRGHDEAHHFPLGNLVAEIIEHSAGQLDFQQVGAVALHERRGADQERARVADLPGDEDTAGVVFVSLDDELLAAEIGAAEPGDVVAAAHVDVFEPAWRNPFPIVDDESHQAHGGANLGTNRRSTGRNCTNGRPVPGGATAMFRRTLDSTRGS